MSKENSSYHVMAKPIGPVCNLNCSYCFYLEKEKLYGQVKDFRMPDDVLETFIRGRLSDAADDVVQFAWQGGEPTLLGLGYFKKVVKLQQKNAGNKKIENTFQTNGILINNDWAAFFKDNHFLVGLSIDGPEKIHNRYRRTKANGATFQEVMKGVEALKKYSVSFNTLTVIQQDNSKYPLEVYRFLKDIGDGFMQFIPIVERDFTGSSLVISPWSVEASQFATFLMSIFDEWVREDVGRIYVQYFDVALEAWLGLQPKLCIFQKECGKALALEHNGDVYSCDHYVFPEHYLGNLMETGLSELVNSEKQKRFGRDKYESLSQKCLNCKFLQACYGECPKNRLLEIPGSTFKQNYLCDGYYAFFEHIDPYMSFMASALQNGQAPAQVMAWAKKKDRGFPSLKPKRNEPCPCGSGKKYKHCCGSA